MAEKKTTLYTGVNTSNAYGVLGDDVEKQKSEKDGKAEKSKEAAPRKKVEKKDKEKHGKQNKAPAADTRQKKHEGFDRRPGPGPQRKPDKRTGGGKWDQDQQRIIEDQFVNQDQDDQDPSRQGDAKDAKDKKEYFDLDEWKAKQEQKRPDGDALKPRAPRTDGDFREVKEFKKEKVENLKMELPQPEVKKIQQDKKVPVEKKGKKEKKTSTCCPKEEKGGSSKIIFKSILF